VKFKSRAARRRERWNLALGGLLLLATAAVIAAAIYFFQAARQERLDAADLCPASGPRGHVILLVDRTDPMSFIQEQAFLTYLKAFGEGGVGEGELFSVFVVGEDFAAAAQPWFNMCNPGRGEDKSRWTSNPEQIRRRFESKFLAPMQRQAGQLRAAAPAKTSPILEMLQLAAIEGFRQDHASGRKKLVIVSDMLHNTPEFSLYREAADFDAFRQTPYFQKSQADLAGVEVEIFLLMNAPQRQNLRLVNFWERYFQAMGARLVHVKPVEG
jgi:hypothetical protein